MSLILDALKKSENARQQKAGPVLAAAPGTMDSRRGPVWPWVVAGVLLINAALLALMLTRQDRSEDAVVTVQPASRPAPGPAPRPAVTDPPPVLSAQPPAPRPAQPAPETASTAGEEPAIVTLTRERRMRALQSVAGTPLPSSTENSPVSAPAATAPRQGGTVVYEGEPAPARGPGTVIYEGEETAAETPERSEQVAVPEPRPPSSPPTSGSGSLPSYQDLQLKGELSLAPMHVDIHVYSDDPAERFVFINMVKYREGEKTREGPVVEAIDSAGAVLSHQGRRFVLPRD